MIPLEPSPHIEIPRLTLWQRIPPWLRIGLWGVLVAMLINTVLAVRIWYGLQDPPEVAALRDELRRAGMPIFHISYVDQQPTVLSRIPMICDLPQLAAGLRGRTSDDVVSIRLDEYGTDEHLRTIGRDFRNIQSLYLGGSRVTFEGLRALGDHRSLRWLDLRATDVGDDLADVLPHLMNLNGITLDETLVSDAFIDRLLTEPACSLHSLNVSWTDITVGAVARLTAKFPKLRTNLTQLPATPLESTVIRWADGQRSGNFRGSYKYRWAQVDAQGKQTRSSETSSDGGLSRSHFRMMFDGPEFADGPYRLTLKLGSYEAVPVDLSITNGQAIPSRVQFVMPCTKEEALRSARK